MKHLFENLLFSDLGSEVNNIAFLIFRVLLAWELFRVHGLKKFRLVNGKKEHVPNPLHLPEKLNGFVATFSDSVVPFLVMFGIATRLVILPVIGVTTIGYFIVHKNDTAEIKDIPYMYTLSFLLLLILGAGTYSLDSYILNKL